MREPAFPTGFQVVDHQMIVASLGRAGEGQKATVGRDHGVKIVEAARRMADRPRAAAGEIQAEDLGRPTQRGDIDIEQAIGRPSDRGPLRNPATPDILGEAGRNRDDPDPARLAGAISGIGDPRPVPGPARRDVVQAVAGQLDRLAARQPLDEDVPAEQVRAGRIGEHRPVGGQGGVALDQGRRHQRRGAVDRPFDRRPTTHDDRRDDQGNHDEQTPGEDPVTTLGGRWSRGGGRPGDFRGRRRRRGGHAIAQPGYGFDRERSARGLLRQATQTLDAAVERVVADDGVAPARLDQGSARHHLALGAGQGDQHLHHARLQADPLAVDDHFPRRGMDPQATEPKIGLPRQIDAALWPEGGEYVIHGRPGYATNSG